MWQHFLSLEQRRRRSLRRARPGPLRDFLAQPFPDKTQSCRDTTYLALDLETTGLNPAKDQILSFGWVVLRGDVVDLSSSEHRVVRCEQELQEKNIVIHGLTHDRLARGEPLATALAALLQALAGKVLVAHHAKIEVGFLRQACRQLCGGEFVTPVVDTLALEQRRLERQGQPLQAGLLRLAALREHYHLPRYPAHNALSDALGAAELLLAHLACYQGKSVPPLARLLVKL